MCDVWCTIATQSRPENYLNGLQAADAALFCCEFMQRSDLISVSHGMRLAHQHRHHAPVNLCARTPSHAYTHTRMHVITSLPERAFKNTPNLHPQTLQSPVVQARLVDVITAMMDTARRGRRGRGGSGGGGVHFGDQRGLAGAVMDNQRIRSELPLSLMTIYSEVHAVAGLDVDADTGFDKFTVRVDRVWGSGALGVVW